jgi:hypothetical protein
MSYKLYQATLGTAANSGPRPSFFRRTARRVVRLGGLHALFLAGCLGNAYLNKDQKYLLERRTALTQSTTTPGVGSALGWLKFWEWNLSGSRVSRSRSLASVPSYLSPSELECVEAVTSLFAFDLHSRVFDKLMPTVTLSDPWFTLRGALELKDAWYFLSCLCNTSDPIVTAVARSTQNRNVLFMDMETMFELRYVGVRFTMPSGVKLTLEEFGPARRRVREIEHRWFGAGPITGTPSYPDTFLARGADALRHLDGFAMSVIMTTEHKVEAYAATRSTTATAA